MTFSLRLLTVATLALTFLAATPTASAQHSQFVRTQLSNSAFYFAGEGFPRTHEPIVSDLWDNGTESITLTLRAGRTYAIYGACDRDCSDIDTWLYSPEGYLVDSSTDSSDLPLMLVTPRRTGTYTVRTRMYSCYVEPCFYGIGVSGRR